MSDDATTTLISCPTEFEAETIAASLRSQGITAQVIGGGLTGFRAEAPAMAKVVVLSRDLTRAKNALRAIKAESVDLDWDEVNTGDRQDALDAGVLAPEVQAHTHSSSDPATETARAAFVMFAVLAVLCVMAMVVRTPPPIQLSLACITLVTLIYAVYARSRLKPSASGPEQPELQSDRPSGTSSSPERPRRNDDRPPPVYKFPGPR